MEIKTEFLLPLCACGEFYSDHHPRCPALRAYKALKAENAAQKREILNWTETAAQYARNSEYYQKLVVSCGTSIGHSAYVCDDGSISEDVLCAKVPKIVANLVSENTALREAARWVPVSERLPEISKSVLITNGVDSVGHARRKASGWEIVASNDFVRSQDVTGWRHLPPPIGEQG